MLGFVPQPNLPGYHDGSWVSALALLSPTDYHKSVMGRDIEKNANVIAWQRFSMRRLESINLSSFRRQHIHVARAADPV
jgi:hypothetical protein